MKKQLFLATPFSGQVDSKTGEMQPAFRKQITAIMRALRANGFKVFCALEYEDWEVSSDPPEVGTRKDLMEIDAADALVAVIHDTPTAGVQYAMGYAYAKGKPVFLATSLDTPLAYFNQGLANLGHVLHVPYDTPALLAREVKTRMAEQ
jgi:nucleoside 2-deoxyribosyltransferase